MPSRQTLISFFHWLSVSMTLLLVAITPFAFTWINEELFEFNKMMVAYAFSAVIIGSTAIKVALSQRLEWKKTPLDIPIAVFLISQLISTLLSIHPRTSWLGYYTRFHGGFLSLLCYVGLYYSFIYTFSKKLVPYFLITVMAAAILVSVYAIPEHFGFSPSCWLITNGEQGGVSCWVQDVQSRIFGTFGQPNWLAAYAVLLLPLALVWPIFFSGPQAWVKNLSRTATNILWGAGSLTSGLLMTTLLFTRSRSGFLGLAAAIAVMLAAAVWLYVVQKKNRPSFAQMMKKPAALSIVAGIVLCTLAIGWWGSPFFDGLASKLKATPPATADTQAVVANRLDEGGTNSGEIRQIVWSGAIKVWQRYPWFGSGVETFAYSYYQDRPASHNLVSEWDFLYNKAHNEFLNYLATTGIVGLASYCALLVVMQLSLVWPLLKPKPQTTTAVIWLGVAIAAGNSALAISNFFGFSTVMVTILMFLLPASFYVIARPEESQPTANSHKGVDWEWILIAGVVLAVLTALLQVKSWWQADYFFSQGKNYLQAGQVATGVQLLGKAVELSPNEALFYDELASTYGEIAVAFAQQQDATSSAQFSVLATQFSDNALKLNHRHINFLRSRARTFINLASIDGQYLRLAQEALTNAIALAPTEAKLIYNLGLVQIAAGDVTAGMQTLEKTVALKPNYEGARFELGKQYQAQGRTDAAVEQYRYILERINPKNETVRNQLTALEASISGQIKTKK